MGGWIDGVQRERQRNLFRNTDIATNSVTLEVFISLSKPRFLPCRIQFCCCEEDIRSFRKTSSTVAVKGSH